MTRPESGRSRPPMRFSSVVFPEPDGPMSATNEPFSTDSVTPSSTVTVSLPRRYRLTTFSMDTRSDIFSSVDCGGGRRSSLFRFVQQKLGEGVPRRAVVHRTVADFNPLLLVVDVDAVAQLDLADGEAPLERAVLHRGRAVGDAVAAAVAVDAVAFLAVVRHHHQGVPIEDVPLGHRVAFDRQHLVLHVPGDDLRLRELQTAGRSLHPAVATPLADQEVDLRHLGFPRDGHRRIRAERRKGGRSADRETEDQRSKHEFLSSLRFFVLWGSGARAQRLRLMGTAIGAGGAEERGVGAVDLEEEGALEEADGDDEALVAFHADDLPVHAGQRAALDVHVLADLAVLARLAGDAEAANDLQRLDLLVLDRNGAAAEGDEADRSGDGDDAEGVMEVKTDKHISVEKREGHDLRPIRPLPLLFVERDDLVEAFFAQIGRAFELPSRSNL